MYLYTHSTRTVTTATALPLALEAVTATSISSISPPLIVPPRPKNHLTSSPTPVPGLLAKSACCVVTPVPLVNATAPPEKD